VHAGVAVDNPNAVVVGLAPSQFHYGQLNAAFRSATLCTYIKKIIFYTQLNTYTVTKIPVHQKLTECHQYVTCAEKE